MAMTTFATRSRRAEVLRPPHPHASALTLHPPPPPPPQSPQSPLGQPQQQQQQHLIATTRAHNSQPLVANALRGKRRLDPSAHDFDPVVAKKPKFAGIAVEIPARLRAKEAGDAKPQQHPPAKPALAGPTPPNHARAPPPRPTSSITSQPATVARQHAPRTKHQDKVANVLKHELDRLQPAPAETKDQGRELRSQKATRFKSELSAYFPDYDEVIGNDPKEQRACYLIPLPLPFGDPPPASIKLPPIANPTCV